MIHPDVLVLHIDIQQARNFVDISKLAQPNTHTLYILHEKGRVLKAWDNQRGKTDVGPTIQASLTTAEELCEKHRVDKVQLIDRETYQAYLQKAGSLEKAKALNGYDFRQWARNLKGQMGEGLIIHPVTELYDHFHFVDRTQKFLGAKLPPDCVLLVGVHEGESW